ncbi:MAG: RsmB/NOP family class I SAM-dependent RNA methyltransferase [Nanoarchaeota archaeon]|nr:RsmB/NOP family class I SAM-dependent RNA methyltransferase [Nanoarchaeota archaeon]
MIESIPNAKDLEIKPAFEERYRLLLGKDYDTFMKYSTSYIRKAIRVNTLKITVPELVKRLEDRWTLEPVPWCKEGFWIRHKGKGNEERFDVGNLVEHMLGFIYVQDPASMIPPLVLDPNPGDLVLDLCAAPGSKTTQLAMYMQNKGVIVANDIKVDRLKPLGLNLQRCGVSNAIISQMYGQRFSRMEQKFDKVLVDGPCTGTGTIRRSLKTLRMWSPNMVKKLAKEQKRLVESGFSVLKKGGTLVYSTCTQEPEENEGVVSWLLEKYPDADLVDIKLNIQSSKPILEFAGVKFDSQVSKCLRIYPQDNDSEGFFVAKIRKTEEK